MKKRSSTARASLGPAPGRLKMEKILNCAEREFAARGYEGTPLHRIAKAAKVNQALISYYFGSKEKLYQAVFLRRGRELTRERLRLLDELEKRTSGRPTVEDLVRSFLVPAITMGYEGADGRAFLKLQARLHSEPTEITGKLRKIVYDEATLRYIETFKAALPQIEPTAIVWRMTMMIGAYLYIVSDASRLEQLSNGACHINDQDEVIRQLSAFLTGGFKSPLEDRRTRPGPIEKCDAGVDARGS